MSAGQVGGSFRLRYACSREPAGGDHLIGLWVELFRMQPKISFVFDNDNIADTDIHLLGMLAFVLSLDYTPIAFIRQLYICLSGWGPNGVRAADISIYDR